MIDYSNFSEKQINEARELAENKLIVELDENNFLVSSINKDNSYEVEKIFDRPYDLYCKCKGWKFSRVEKTCKHCLAIKMYLEQVRKSKKANRGRKK